MKAEIFSIGTELLMGEITDTNAVFLASRLPALGIQLQWVSQIGDSPEMLEDAFKRGLSRSDVIFTSGGLGPTSDDLTRESIARTLGQEMTVRDDLLANLKAWFEGRGMEMPATNIKQATLIPSSEVIPNRRGTAPGWWVEEDGKIIVAMPGPPNELQSIWEEEVAPRLRQRVRGEVILTRNIKTTGLSEGGLDEMVAEYLGKENPYLGIYAKADGIHLRIIARAPDEETARSLIRPVEEGLSSIVGPYIWGYDDETPEEAVGQLLMEKKLTLATMECCTGGLLASNITDSPDSDSYFKGGIVVYGDGSAVATGVPAGVIESFGLASQEAAEAMALVSRARLRADIGIGVAGMTGPDEMPCSPGGGSIDPWGLTHIAIALPPESPGDDNLRYFPSRLPPRRSVIKRRAASTALIELRRVLNAL